MFPMARAQHPRRRSSTVSLNKPNPIVGVYWRPPVANAGPLFPLLYQFEYRFRTVEDQDIMDMVSGKTARVDVLLMSGGWYFFEKQRAPVGQAVVRLVQEGMGAVGICCGQINLCQLGLVPADLVKMYGVGPTRLEPVDGEHPVLAGVAKKSDKPWRQYDPFIVLRYNGWPMRLKDGACMIAAYDIDKQWAAIAASEPGKGRCVAISPHPEGKVCSPGEFEDREQLPLVYDGVQMGTAKIIDNAILWAAHRKVEARGPQSSSTA